MIVTLSQQRFAIASKNLKLQFPPDAVNLLTESFQSRRTEVTVGRRGSMLQIKTNEES